MFCVRGYVELPLLDAGAAIAQSNDRQDIAHMRAAGIDLQWRRARADVAMEAGVLAISTGRARDPANGQTLSASGWIARYREREDDAPRDVDGGFAVTIVDCVRRRVLAFVDPFAVETLCYRSVNGTHAFSDAACDVPGTQRAVSAQAIYDYLYFHVIPAPQTVFDDVSRLEGSHRLTVDMTRKNMDRYWTPAFVEDNRRDLQGRKRAFLSLVKAAVESEADGPATACFLSGGTDSSTVAGMLSQIRGQPVPAYSIGFRAEGYDEMDYARIAARHFGCVHREYYVTPADVTQAMPAVAASFDQPFGNSSVLPTYLCALRAREDGVTRMLAGDGGDELFGGNSRYAMQKVFDAYQVLPRSLRARVLEPLASRRAFRVVPGLRQLGGYVRHSMVEMPARLETFNLLHRLEADSPLDPAFRASVDERAPLARQQAVWASVDAKSLVNRMLGYDWKHTLGDSDLPKVRGATALAGVTVGYPFLSRALTEFSLSIPPDWKVRGLTLRWFFKGALRGFLPAEILRKKKHGFGLPFGHWVVSDHDLRALVEDSLGGIARRGIVRPAFAAELITRRLPTAPGYYGEMIWILVMLEQWMRAHDASLLYGADPTRGIASPR